MNTFLQKKCFTLSELHPWVGRERTRKGRVEDGSTRVPLSRQLLRLRVCGAFFVQCSMVRWWSCRYSGHAGAHRGSPPLGSPPLIHWEEMESRNGKGSGGEQRPEKNQAQRQGAERWRRNDENQHGHQTNEHDAPRT